MEIPIAASEKAILVTNDRVDALTTSRRPRGAGSHGGAGDPTDAEVAVILDAALRVMSSSAPEAPRVSDIIAAAGTCNKTFYRHFRGKDDLVMAVMERGIEVVTHAIAAEMAVRPDPVDQVTCWVEGLWAQLTDPHRFRMCRATIAQMSEIAQRRTPDDEIMAPLRELLTAPIATMGRRDPDRDGDAVFHCTMGTLRRYLGSGHRPPRADVEHLMGFCLGGIGVGEA